LKIDGSFVRNLQNGAEAKAIVCAVIALADALGMVTTGEGVETLAQYQSLHAERCVEAQGYFLSVPLRAKEIEAFLHQPKPNRKFLQTRHEVEKPGGRLKRSHNQHRLSRCHAIRTFGGFG
jgi:predicted signal transduction protein with EAL and GGDEF domain